MNDSYQNEIPRVPVSLKFYLHTSSYNVSIIFREMKGFNPEQVAYQLPQRRAMMAC